MKAFIGLCVIFLAAHLAMAAEPGTASPRSAFQTLVNAEQRLTERIFEPLWQKAPDKNVVFAPYCLFESLAILESASSGETADGFRHVLQLKSELDRRRLVQAARTSGLPLKYVLPVTVAANDGYGVRITADPPQQSEAWNAGLRRDDLLFSLRGQPIRQPDDLTRQLIGASRTVELGGYSVETGLPFEARQIRLEPIRDESRERKRHPARFAVALWLREGLPTRKEWTAALQKEFGAQQFSSRADADVVAELWRPFFQESLATSEAPRLQQLPNTAAFVLISSLVIDASWRLPFSKAETVEGTFRSPTGPLTTTFLRRTSQSGYFADDNVQVLELPFRDSSLVCRLALPAETSANRTQRPDKLIEALRNMVRRSRDELPLRVVDVSVPKFEFQSDVSFNEPLKELGAGVAWTQDADFSAMTGNHAVRLDDVRQEVKVAFQETGVKVVATNTSVGVLKGSSPEPEYRFHADRPFLFSIQDESGLILAVGQVASPNATKHSRSTSAD